MYDAAVMGRSPAGQNSGLLYRSQPADLPHDQSDGDVECARV